MVIPDTWSILAGPDADDLTGTHCIWNLLRLLRPVYEAVDCKTDGINAHTIFDHILRKIQEEFKGVVT